MRLRYGLIASTMDFASLAIPERVTFSNHPLLVVSYQKDQQSLLADVGCTSTTRLTPTPQRQGLGLEE